MTEPANGNSPPVPAMPKVRWYVLILAALAIFLAVGTWSYEGLIYWLAEWQFDKFGRYFPSFTIVLLLALAAILLIIARMIWRRVQRKREGQLADDEQTSADQTGADQTGADQARDARALGQMGFARRFFSVFTALAFTAGLGTFIHYLQLPRPTKAVTTINLASSAPSQLNEGSVVIRGIQAIGPIARTSEDITFDRSSVYLVPVGQTRLENGSAAANLFVQVLGSARRDVPTEVSGVLRRNALPSEVAVMYRAAGFPVMSDSSVVFLDAQASRKPSLNVLITCFALALIGALFALVARRRERNFAKHLEKERERTALVTA